MKIGAMNHPAHDLGEELQRFAELGFDYLDLTVEGPAATPAIVRDRLEVLQQTLGNAGMGVVCHLPWYLQIASPLARVRQAFVEEAVEVIEVAGRLGAPTVTIHPDFLVLHRPEAQIAGPTIESLRVLLAAATRHGVSLCLENFEKGHVSTGLFERVFESLPELRWTLDVGHACLHERTLAHLLTLLHSHAGRLAHVHLHDNFGSKDDHLPLGVGRIDIAGAVAALHETGYDGTITLEVHAADRDYLALSRDKLRRLWGGNPQSGRQG